MSKPGHTAIKQIEETEREIAKQHSAVLDAIKKKSDSLDVVRELQQEVSFLHSEVQALRHYIELRFARLG
jgi:hypothetical protein